MDFNVVIIMSRSMPVNGDELLERGIDPFRVERMSDLFRCPPIESVASSNEHLDEATNHRHEP